MLHRPLLICLLAATATAAQSAQPPTAPYRAQGSGPAWSLTIADGRMTYESPGKAPVTVAAPSAVNEGSETRYETRKLSLTIMPLACTDEASGRRYVDSVYVTLPRSRRAGRRNAGPDSGLTFDNLRTGCGGAELPADSLNGTSWLFVEIAGQATKLTGDLLRDDRYAIDFYAEGFVGYGGCNRFSAAYSRTGDILTTRPPWGSTTRNCGEPFFGLERRLIEILRAPVRVSFPDPKTLVLTGDTGTIKLRRTR